MINLKLPLMVLGLVQMVWSSPKYAFAKSDIKINLGKVGLSSSLDVYSKSNYGYGLGLEGSGNFAIPGMAYKFTEDFRIVYRVIKEEYCSREWVRARCFSIWSRGYTFRKRINSRYF